MKESIITFICFMILFYLIGAFIAASFDINQWTVFLRAMIASFGSIISGMITLAIADKRDNH